MTRLSTLLAGILFASLVMAACGTPRQDDQPLAAVDEAALDFTLPTAAGDAFTLSAALSEGPVLLVFYRGHW